MSIKKLQRYEIILCFGAPSHETNEYGEYCLNTDVTELEATNAELVKALEELDECYCEVGYNMTKKDRLRHRKVLANARAALKSARGE